jgi:hypothetical protein
MTNREERVARNESASRDVNEQIEEALEGEPSYIRMICECGNAECERVVAITLAEYERVRSDAVHFVVIKEHVMPDVERVVYETDRFVVVAKRAGTPADVAIEEDPRS